MENEKEVKEKIKKSLFFIGDNIDYLSTQDLRNLIQFFGMALADRELENGEN